MRSVDDARALGGEAGMHTADRGLRGRRGRRRRAWRAAGGEEGKRKLGGNRERGCGTGRGARGVEAVPLWQTHSHASATRHNKFPFLRSPSSSSLETSSTSTTSPSPRERRSLHPSSPPPPLAPPAAPRLCMRLHVAPAHLTSPISRHESPLRPPTPPNAPEPYGRPALPPTTSAARPTSQLAQSRNPPKQSGRECRPRVLT